MKNNSNEEDLKLLQRLQEGDDKAWESAYQSNWVLVSRMVLTNSGTMQDAKDIYQETFAAFYTNVNREGFALTATISTYLYSIARNLWLKCLHKINKGGRFVDVATWADLPLTDNPDDRKEEETMREKLVVETLPQLGEPCADLLKRFYFAKQSMQFIAEALDYKNPKTAKNQKYKCLNRLRALVLIKLDGVKQ